MISIQHSCCGNNYLKNNVSHNQVNFNGKKHKSMPAILEVEAPDGSVLSEVPDTPIVTKPAQLSVLHMHDFHGQSIRMERALTISESFDNGTLPVADSVMDKNMPTDKLKLCSGDMFRGSNPEEMTLVNEFLNLVGADALTLGNHECDSPMADFAKEVKSHNYKIISTNIHPEKQNKMNKLKTGSFIIKINGNKYGVIGASPVDIMEHTKIPKEVSQLHVDDLDSTINEIRLDINEMKKHKVNKIILLSHLGINLEQYIAQNVNDIDLILGGHTHTLFKGIKEGENLFKSPKGEPVLIMQSGKDGQYVGIPNIRFNEFGQIVGINYNTISTDDYERSPVAKKKFDKIIKPDVLGKVDYAEKLPENLYANENPNCDFITDCIRKELNTDIAIMNSSVTRNSFSEGNLEMRDLKSVSPFPNKVVVIKATESELVSAIQERARKTMTSSNNKPGLLQVSGLKYEIEQKTGDLISLKYLNRNGKDVDINIKHPSDKTYTVAIDDFCAKSIGEDIKNRFLNPIKVTNKTQNELVIQSLKKQKKPVQIKTDGRITISKN